MFSSMQCICSSNVLSGTHDCTCTLILDLMLISAGVFSTRCWQKQVAKNRPQWPLIVLMLPLPFICMIVPVRSLHLWSVPIVFGTIETQNPWFLALRNFLLSIDWRLQVSSCMYVYAASWETVILVYDFFFVILLLRRIYSLEGRCHKEQWEDNWKDINSKKPQQINGLSIGNETFLGNVIP